MLYLMRRNARERHVPVPPLHTRKVTHHLYTIWKADDTATAHCIEACCHISAKSQYTAAFVIIDKTKPS